MEIEIEIDNLLVFAKVAFFLDQDEVLQRILKVRKHWLKEPIPYEKLATWLKVYKPNLTVTPEAERSRADAVDQFETDTTHHNLSEYDTTLRSKDLANMRDVDYEIEYTLRLLNLNSNFKDLILKAIVCNEVREDDYPNLQHKSSYKFNDWLFEDSLFKQKIKKAYDSGREKSKIKRDRKFYWMWQTEKEKGAGVYDRVLDQWNEAHPDDYVSDINIIEHGVKNYRDFLSQ